MFSYEFCSTWNNKKAPVIRGSVFKKETLADDLISCLRGIWVKGFLYIAVRVAGQMLAQLEDGFHIFLTADGLGDLFRGLGFLRIGLADFVGDQVSLDFRFQLQDLVRGFLAGFHTGLMVRVDVDQRSVESHRAFIKSDQNSDLERGDVVDRDRDGFAAALEKRLACAQQESL